MEDIKEKISKMFIGAGKNLAQVLGNKAFEFWQRKDFRLYIGFDSKSQTEQDRMFNELEVSVIGLLMLHLDYTQGQVDKELVHVLQMLQREIAAGFVDILSEAGVEKQYVKEWNILIDMRLKEYREDYATALKESKKMKDFNADEALRSSWARIETITIDCLHHIRRGNVKDEDPLWNLLRKWFISLDSTIMHPISKLAQES